MRVRAGGLTWPSTSDWRILTEDETEGGEASSEAWMTLVTSASFFHDTATTAPPLPEHRLSTLMPSAPPERDLIDSISSSRARSISLKLGSEMGRLVGVSVCVDDCSMSDEWVPRQPSPLNRLLVMLAKGQWLTSLRKKCSSPSQADTAPLEGVGVQKK